MEQRKKAPQMRRLVSEFGSMSRLRERLGDVGCNVVDALQAVNGAQIPAGVVVADQGDVFL